MKPYVIKQGDYLTRIAHRLGFVADEVWNDPKNAELKEIRSDPDTLKSGDIVFIPDAPKKKNPFTKESSNSYVAKVPKLPVSLTLDHNGEAIADEKYVVRGLDEELEGTTDANGTVEFEVDVHVKEVVVELVDKKKKYRMLLGNLDPIDEPSGARQRLMQLGIYSATLEGEDQYVAHNPQQLAAALGAFQKKNDLEITKELDEATINALRDAYGC
jgi:hypothetical protein